VADHSGPCESNTSLSCVQVGQRADRADSAAELILNNFTTLLGNSVGRVFGSLFPPQPQFRGRQVVTLHNQRDFLFFRRHRYAFASATQAKLQEIGPRFTLKLRWLRKGLPAVRAADGSVPRGGDVEEADDDDDEAEQQERMDEDAALEEMGKGIKPPKVKNGGVADMGIPPLDEEQEYEWKWKVCLSDYPNRCLADLPSSQKWRYRVGRFSCDLRPVLLASCPGIFMTHHDESIMLRGLQP
jgi:ribosome production factor 1